MVTWLQGCRDIDERPADRLEALLGWRSHQAEVDLVPGLWLRLSSRWGPRSLMKEKENAIWKGINRSCSVEGKRSSCASASKLKNSPVFCWFILIFTLVLLSSSFSCCCKICFCIGRNPLLASFWLLHVCFILAKKQKNKTTKTPHHSGSLRFQALEPSTSKHGSCRAFITVELFLQDNLKD